MSKTCSVQAFWRVLSREGRRLGSCTLTLAMLARCPGSVGVGELHVEARAVRAVGVRRGGDREFGFEDERGAIGDLEGNQQCVGGALRAGERPSDLEGVAVGRVEDEVRAVDRDVDVLDLQGDAFQDLRYRVGAGGVGRDGHGRGLGVDFDLRAHDLGVASGVPLEREGPRDRRHHDREAERGAFVGSGDEHLAAGHGVGIAPEADTDGGVADQAFRPARPGVGQRFFAGFDRGERRE